MNNGSEKTSDVYLKDIIRLKDFKSNNGLRVAIGRESDGNYLHTDLAKHCNLLIAGSDKCNVDECVHSFILSILLKCTPSHAKLLLMSPNIKDFDCYANVPHLKFPLESTTGDDSELVALKWVVDEIKNRQKLFAERGVGDIYGYNKLVDYTGEGDKLPRLLVIISDIDSLYAKNYDEVEQLIGDIPFLQWRTGISLVATSYSPNLVITYKRVMDYFGSKIVFKMDSIQASKKLIDYSYAVVLRDYRDMFYEPLSSPFPIHARSVTISHNDIVKAVESVCGKYR